LRRNQPGGYRTSPFALVWRLISASRAARSSSTSGARSNSSST